MNELVWLYAALYAGMWTAFILLIGTSRQLQIIKLSRNR